MGDVNDPTIEYDDGFDLEAPLPTDPVQQVSATIAVIRIISVLGMGLCMSFGLFISLVGVRGIIVGVPIFLLAIPCYLGMRFAERLALAQERRAAGESN